MLKTQYQPQDAIVLKLISGEELLARFISSSDDEIMLSKVFIVITQVDPRTGQPAMGLMPFITVSDPMGQLPIKSAHILTTIKAPKNHPIISEYTRATSGIQLATSSDVSALQV